MKYGYSLAARMFAGKIDVSYQTLRKWNLSLTLLNALEAVAILLFSLPHNFPIYISFVTVDTLQSKAQGITVTGPAIHPIGSVNLAYLVAGLFVTAAAAHLLSATAGRTFYESGMKRGRNEIRNTQFTIEAFLILTTLALMAGIYDISLLVANGVLVICASLLFYVGGMKHGADKRQPRTSAIYFTVEALLSGLPFIFIAVYAVAGRIFGGGLPSFALLWIYASTLIACGLVAFIRWLIRQQKGKWSNYQYGELWYMVLNILTLTVLGWEIFASILHP